MKTKQKVKGEAEARARIFKALGHPTRLSILELLAKRPHCVCELVEVIPGRQATTSRHLDVLVRAGIVRRRKEGVKQIYTLAMPCILNVLPCINRAIRERVSARR